jgi:GxxExxY protein
VLRVETRLSDEVEALVHETIGCCITVHKTLGPGLLETIYSKAIALELKAAGIAFDPERSYPIFYRGELLYEQRLDFIVGGQMIIEVKSVEHLTTLHDAQLLSYLRVARLRVGLLINFNVPSAEGRLEEKGFVTNG